MKWEIGRQRTGYSKLALWKASWTDCYIIKYPNNSYVPEHIDPVKNKKHYRINILLFGEDNFSGKTIFSTRRLKIFRPDIHLHSVKPVSFTRIILSIGFAI
jgi:hypothetical protein